GSDARRFPGAVNNLSPGISFGEAALARTLNTGSTYGHGGRGRTKSGGPPNDRGHRQRRRTKAQSRADFGEATGVPPAPAPHDHLHLLEQTAPLRVLGGPCRRPAGLTAFLAQLAGGVGAGVPAHVEEAHEERDSANRPPRRREAKRTANSGVGPNPTR